MPQQILYTERITLAPLADGHLEWETELDSDPDVMRYLSSRASTNSFASLTMWPRWDSEPKRSGGG